jgi:hypothetical protein
VTGFHVSLKGFKSRISGVAQLFGEQMEKIGVVEMISGIDRIKQDK